VTAAPVPPEDPVARVQALAEELGREPSQNEVMRACSVSRPTAKKLIAEARTKARTLAVVRDAPECAPETAHEPAHDGAHQPAHEQARVHPVVIPLVGLAVVLAAAAVLSFDALRGLALAVSIPARFAWLLPIAVDAGAAVSCAVWLGRHTPRGAATVAAGMTWGLLVLTVAGNAGHLYMHAHHITPPWWVAVAVGAMPPAIVGGTVHLLVLLTRSRGER
jgi:uncharacterized protein DUF2637